MQASLNWQVFSNSNRNAVIDQLKDVISNNGGCIINSNMFSDLALSLSIEIEENSISKLHQALISIAQVSEFDSTAINSQSNKEWIIYLNVSFGGGTGDLKKEIASVPG